MLLLCKILFIDLNYGQVTGYKTFSKFPETSKHCSCPNFRIVREVGYHLVFKVVNCVGLCEVVEENSLLSSVKLVELGSIYIYIVFVRR